MSFVREFIDRFIRPTPRVFHWEDAVGIVPEAVHESTPPSWRSIGRYCGR